MSERVLGFEDALCEVLARARALERVPAVETVELLRGAARVLAASVVADRDQPGFDRATRDGYAVRAADVAEALRVVGSVRAGESWASEALGLGGAIEIMTGAPLPAGADAVVMVEHTALAEGVLRVEAGRSLRVGENVVPRGAESRAGDVVLPVGRVMGAAEIGVAASCGVSEVRVFARPKVAIVATGDELVELDEPMSAAQIRNSNSYALAALVEAAGGVAERLAIARDNVGELRAQIAEGREADLLVLSGGVSMGKFDLVEQVLGEFGAEFFFTGALIQPGKPIVFGRLRSEKGWTYFFGLPGNPVSAQVCFLLFVAPMLRALAGRSEIAPVFVEARLAEDVRGGAKVTRFLPAEVSGSWEGVAVRVVGWQGSGDVVANARGNGYVVLPAGVEAFAAGETVRVLLR
ncbi:MAG: gephyrin-like molybdotransferase Glp [Acidobacteriaceae bacterium]